MNQTSEAYVIKNITQNDLDDIIIFLSKSLIKESYETILNQLLISQIDFTKSLKIVNEQNNICGLLILCDFPIDKGSPILSINPLLGEFLSQLHNINGYAFVIDKKIRGKNFDKKILHDCLKKIQTYDYIWCGVDNKFNTHNYWKRLGFIDLCHTNEAHFYLYPINKNVLLDIFIIEMMSKIYEKNHN